MAIDISQVDEVKPVTNQKSSGRCWLFACLNAIRIPFTKENNLEDFEFSQGFVFFWDKVSKFLKLNYFHLLKNTFDNYNVLQSIFHRFVAFSNP